MDILMTTIVTWLSVNAALPANYEHPRVEFVPHGAMHAMRATGAPVARHAHQRGNIEALYDDRTRTIYLPRGWKGATPAEQSVLVHEMVHHLQKVAGLKYECAEAREKPAYEAQDKWLAEFGRNLLDEFKLDPMTLLVRTRCMH
jgi:hypothetical protein